ncbi:MAG: hypothetical protein IT508_10905, partial [Burkholderiaceae bacterium]|nr:hypothetical protein [Burkholderiaceae bacterium]
MNGTVPRSKLDAYALQLGNRYAAKSLAGAASTAGAFASFSFTQSATVSAVVEMTISSTVAPSADVYLFGANITGIPLCGVTALGRVLAGRAGNVITSSPAGSVVFNGRQQVLRFEFGVSGANLTYRTLVDGVQVAIVSEAGTWSTGPVTAFIGALSASGTQRWPGKILNVTYTDNNTPS